MRMESLRALSASCVNARAASDTVDAIPAIPRTAATTHVRAARANHPVRAAAAVATARACVHTAVRDDVTKISHAVCANHRVFWAIRGARVLVRNCSCDATLHEYVYAADVHSNITTQSDEIRSVIVCAGSGA